MTLEMNSLPLSALIVAGMLRGDAIGGVDYISSRQALARIIEQVLSCVIVDDHRISGRRRCADKGKYGPSTDQPNVNA
jgi:hypothetical protein